MDPQPMGKVRYLSRLAGRVAARSTVRWSSLWIFLEICLLAAVVGDVAAGLPPAQGAAAVAGMPRPAQGPALLLQKITFEPPQAAAVGQPIVTFTPPASARIDQPATLTATASSWLPVTYTSGTPDVCTVSGATFAPIAAGPCTVVASQPGDTQYAPADSITGSFPVQKIPQTIDFRPPQDVAFGRPVTLIATASPGPLVSYRTSTPGVCTVSGRTVTTRAAGACAITASQGGDDRYAPARDAARSFRIERAAQTITFTAPDGMTLGQLVTLFASAGSGLDVSHQADTPAVCSVSGATLTAIAADTCTVTASQGGSDRYAAARDIAQSFDVASPTSGFPGALTILLGAVVFAAAGATSLVRRVRRSHRPPEPEPTVRADPVPGPPPLVSVRNTGAGVTHTVRIESSPGASITRIKEGKS